MSGLSSEDRESLGYALGPWATCDVDAIVPAVEAIVTRAVNEALTEVADAIDRGPTFPLPPSVIGQLIRERRTT